MLHVGIRKRINSDGVSHFGNDLSRLDSHTITIMDLSGKISLSGESARLRDVIAEVIASGSKKVLLNLAAVHYIDSAGLGELVSAFTSMRRAGGEIRLLNVTKHVNDLLVITKLVTVFHVSDDEAEAIDSFGT
jgi:anti-sigma B factor antagonist